MAKKSCVCSDTFGPCGEDMIQFSDLDKQRSEYNHPNRKYSYRAGVQYESMADLILARIGKFGISWENLGICKSHFEKLGPRWEDRRTSCQMKLNCSSGAADRQISIEKSEAIFFSDGKLFPAGTPICKDCNAYSTGAVADLKQV